MTVNRRVIAFTIAVALVERWRTRRVHTIPRRDSLS